MVSGCGALFGLSIGRPTRARLEANRQARGSMHVQGLARFPRLGAGQLQSLQPSEQIAKTDPRLEPRQCGPKAGMDAVSERDMRIGIAPDIELAGIRKLPGIAICRP